VTATRCPAFTTTHRVVHRVHCSTANLGTTSPVTVSTSLTELYVLVVRVADAANRSHALNVDPSELTRGHKDDSILAFTGHKLR
jgi:hypothetical protein